MNKKRYKLPVAVFVILKKDNLILLHKRHNTGWKDGMFDVPSGHLEENENFIEAACREVKEEVGVKVDIGSCELKHTLYAQFPDTSYIQLYFIASKFEGTPTIMEPDKCSELGWFELSEIPSNTVPYLVHALKNLNKKSYCSIYNEQTD
jgi:8-oxo-dGTP diphosphatase